MLERLFEIMKMFTQIRTITINYQIPVDELSNNPFNIGLGDTGLLLLMKLISRSKFSTFVLRSQGISFCKMDIWPFLFNLLFTTSVANCYVSAFKLHDYPK